jgi:hypothetical protein
LAPLIESGAGARHVIWDSKERVFICGSGCLPSDRSEGISHPSAKDWSLFWRIVDNLDAWAWGGNHTTEFICDGGDWFLSIRHQGRSLEAQGIYLNKLPRFLGLFGMARPERPRKAVVRLTSALGSRPRQL